MTIPTPEEMEEKINKLVRHGYIAGNLTIMLTEWQHQIEQRQWISVTERLPEYAYDLCIIYFKDGSGEMVVMPGCWVKNKFYDYTEAWEVENVTHWMPLPDPPEEEIK